jgi:hypothetical protein
MRSGGTHTDPRELGFGIEAGAILLLHLWLLMSLSRIIVRRYAPRVLGLLTVVVLPVLVFIDVHDWIRAYR